MSRHARRQQIRVRPVVKPFGKSAKKWNIVVPTEHQNESPRAQMYMFQFRIGDGRRQITLKNGVYNYGIEKCPDSFNGKARCPRGDECRYAHNNLEILFHPLAYKTRPCFKKTSCRQRDSCARAHTNEEMRILRIILGRDWKLCDPVPPKKKKSTRKQSKTAKKRNGVSCGGSENTESDSASMMSTCSDKLTNMSVSTSPPLEEEEKEAKSTGSGGDHEDDVSEFERWFGGVFDIDDEGSPFIGYLRRFEASGLDDICFLWELSGEMPGKLSDLLRNEIGICDEATRRVIRRELGEYKAPRRVGAWMSRVVGLPQYAARFEKMAQVVDALARMALDDGALAEMGISSVGHRARILLEIGRVA